MTKKQKIFTTTLAVVVLVASAGFFIGYDRIFRKAQLLTQIVTVDKTRGEQNFPVINQKDLTETQKAIVRITKQEFEGQYAGVKYSEGVKEAWCADFVSWVMREAKAPLKNQNSGSWRIPGTFTLKDYYIASGRFRTVDSGYLPKLGDVAIYRGSPIFGDHANIVLTNQDGVLTTVGGNENNRIRVYRNTTEQYDGLLGYGIIEP